VPVCSSPFAFSALRLHMPPAGYNTLHGIRHFLNRLENPITCKIIIMSLSSPHSLDDKQSSTAIRRVVLSAMQVQSDLVHLGSHYPGNVLGCRKFESDDIARKMRAFATSEAQLKLAIDCTSEEDLGLPEDAWATDPQARASRARICVYILSVIQYVIYT
jgi:hypothetical protein